MPDMGEGSEEWIEPETKEGGLRPNVLQGIVGHTIFEVVHVCPVILVKSSTPLNRRGLN